MSETQHRTHRSEPGIDTAGGSSHPGSGPRMSPPLLLPGHARHRTKSRRAGASPADGADRHRRAATAQTPGPGTVTTAAGAPNRKAATARTLRTPQRRTTPPRWRGLRPPGGCSTQIRPERR